MLKFESGHFTRSWKHGYHDWDPAWTAAEKTTVNTSVAAIVAALPGLIQIVAQQLTIAHSVHPLVFKSNTYFNRWHLWMGRIGKTLKMFSDMQTDLGTGGKSIILRKATDLNTADEIVALCEFIGSTPRWVISVNGNAADTKCHFFAKANAAKATASLFHELTHLYGTEDSGVIGIENAHQLEPLMSANAAAHLRRLLAKQRQFTMLGDRVSPARGAQMTLGGLKAVYGIANCWDRAQFAATFTGDPVNGLITRIADKVQGNISIVWDTANRPLYFYNFR